MMKLSRKKYIYLQTQTKYHPTSIAQISEITLAESFNQISI